MKNRLCICIGLVCLFLLSACTTVPDHATRQEHADQIAASGGLQCQKLSTDHFMLASYRRVTKHDAPVTIYIEGDGYAWASSDMPSRDPTPVAPVALELAAKDSAANVIYLARPCQFSGFESSECSVAYWTSARFSPEVIRTYDAALNQIKAQTKATAFHLVGFSGGGNIALLLASHRQDILSVRTVAGNIDHRAWTELHGISPLTESLNAADVAGKLAHIPQLHFVGENDATMPMEVAKAYQQQFQNKECICIEGVANVTHTTGWTNRWPELLGLPLPCARKS